MESVNNFSTISFGYFTPYLSQTLSNTSDISSLSASPYDGYSDHTLGIEAVLLAIARGATVIEKHFTLDKSDKTIRDHALSATPQEFGDMVKYARAIERLVSLGI